MDYLFVNPKGEFIVLGNKNESSISFRNAHDLSVERRLEIRNSIYNMCCGFEKPFLLTVTE